LLDSLDQHPAYSLQNAHCLVLTLEGCDRRSRSIHRKGEILVLQADRGSSARPRRGRRTAVDLSLKTNA
jgi:hypothetical protein